MAGDEDNPAGGASDHASGPWLAGYSERVARAGEDTMRVGATAADRWARRSLDDTEWSVDSVTADVIADWDEMTPLIGRWLDLWLEAVQQANKGPERAGDDGQNDAGRNAAGQNAAGESATGQKGSATGQKGTGQKGTTAGQPDMARLMRRRMEEYVQLWEGAAGKLRNSSYRSEDLLDDWFRFWGKAVRDVTAGAALLWDAGVPPRRRENPDGRADQR